MQWAYGARLGISLQFPIHPAIVNRSLMLLQPGCMEIATAMDKRWTKVYCLIDRKCVSIINNPHHLHDRK